MLDLANIFSQINSICDTCTTDLQVAGVARGYCLTLLSRLVDQNNGTQVHIPHIADASGEPVDWSAMATSLSSSSLLDAPYTDPQSPPRPDRLPRRARAIPIQCHSYHEGARLMAGRLAGVVSCPYSRRPSRFWPCSQSRAPPVAVARPMVLAGAAGFVAWKATGRYSEVGPRHQSCMEAAILRNVCSARSDHTDDRAPRMRSRQSPDPFHPTSNLRDSG